MDPLEFKPGTRCDFCGAYDLGRVWFRTTPSVTRMPTPLGVPGDYHDDGEWGACPLCAGFIMLKDRDGLLDRCLREIPRNTGRAVCGERTTWLLDTVFWPHYLAVGTMEVDHGSGREENPTAIDLRYCGHPDGHAPKDCPDRP